MYPVYNELSSRSITWRQWMHLPALPLQCEHRPQEWRDLWSTAGCPERWLTTADSEVLWWHSSSMSYKQKMLTYRPLKAGDTLVADIGNKYTVLNPETHSWILTNVFKARTFETDQPASVTEVHSPWQHKSQITDKLQIDQNVTSKINLRKRIRGRGNPTWQLNSMSLLVNNLHAKKNYWYTTSVYYRCHQQCHSSSSSSSSNNKTM